MTDTILEAHELRRSYGSVKAVDGVSFELDRGEVLTLLGPSGCGKSTTLRLVAGLEEPDGGEIKLHGKIVASASKRIFVPAEKRKVGLVFQSYAIWPHMTVEQNVAYPLEIRRIPRAQVKAKVEEVLSLVGLDGLGERPATQLSGGQQQRVALARALAYEPDVLLLDEPLSNLDAKLRAEMRVQLKALEKRLATAILYVTHDQAEAMALSHRVAVMRNGKIEQLGRPSEVYEAPSTYFVQNFVGRTLTFQGVVRSSNGTSYVELDDRTRLLVDGHNLPTANSRVQVAVRPEDVSLDLLPDRAGVNTLSGRLQDLIYFGDHFECVLSLGGCEIVLDAPKSAVLVPGQEVAVRLNPARMKTWPV